MLDGWQWAGLTARQVALLGGIGAAVAVAMFLLRPRPPTLLVSSHVLWEKLVGRRRDPLWKELLLLLLQLLAIAGLAIALGDLRPDEGAQDGDTAVRRIWVVDRSLSMGAVDGERRIDRVRARLLDELDELPDHVEIGLVGAAASPELLAPLGRDRQRTALALRLLDVDGVEADVEAAVALARTQGAATIEVFTDDAAVSGGDGVLIRAPFHPLPNLSITAFDLRGSEGIPAEEEAVVRVKNHSSVVAECTLALETVDARLGEARLRLEPGEEQTRRYRFAPLDPGGVEAILRETSFEGAPDPLPADDRAYAWIEPVRPVRVDIVGGQNRYLERVLALVPGLQLRRLQPAEYRGGRDADVVFFDGWLPERLPDRAFLVAPPKDGAFFEHLGFLANPAVTDWNREHPLFRGLVLRDLQVQRSAVFRPREGDVRLVGSPSGALVLARQDGRRKHVAWGFDFGASDLPLRLAFPQTVINTLLWMRQDRAVGAPPGGRHPLAAPLWLGAAGPLLADPRVAVRSVDPRPPAEPGPGGPGESAEPPSPYPGDASPDAILAVTDLLQRAIAVKRGDELAARRATTAVPVGDGLRPWHFARPGLWRVDGGGWQVDLAVNLFDHPESDLSSVPQGVSGALPVPDELPPVEPSPPLPWLLLAAAAGAALTLEFALWTR